MRTPTRVLQNAFTAFMGWVTSVTVASAAVFDGPGIGGAIEQANGIAGLPSGDVRSTVVRIIQSVLSFLALIAVITIIIAGIILIVSLGNEEQKERAKRIIFYTLIGLVVILFARVIVGIVTVYLADQVA